MAPALSTAFRTESLSNQSYGYIYDVPETYTRLDVHLCLPLRDKAFALNFLAVHQGGITARITAHQSDYPLEEDLMDPLFLERTKVGKPGQRVYLDVGSPTGKSGSLTWLSVANTLGGFHQILSQQDRIPCFATIYNRRISQSFVETIVFNVVAIATSDTNLTTLKRRQETEVFHEQTENHGAL